MNSIMGFQPKKSSTPRDEKVDLEAANDMNLSYSCFRNELFGYWNVPLAKMATFINNHWHNKLLQRIKEGKNPGPDSFGI